MLTGGFAADINVEREAVFLHVLPLGRLRAFVASTTLTEHWKGRSSAAAAEARNSVAEPSGRSQVRHVWLGAASVFSMALRRASARGCRTPHPSIRNDKATST
jgi:hypothetical protein